MKTNQDFPLIFERSRAGRRALDLPQNDVPTTGKTLPEHLRRQEAAALPEVSQVDLIRHFTALSRRNFGVDNGFYPLGSCTMKYNPKINEDIARIPGFAQIHPEQPPETVQGALQVIYELGRMLSEITAMDEFTLQPAAGAHGELTGLMLIKAYHLHNGDSHKTEVLVPDSAHGTNPASAAMAGFDVVEVKSNMAGLVDLEDLAKKVSDNTAALMLTNPNTLGLFEKDVKEIADIVHAKGGLLYYDGANLNAIMGICRPGDMGFDVVHLNLHKTFSTPHGGGGPGSGPVGVKKPLIPYLPVPTVKQEGQTYTFDYNRPLSIGRVKSFYGNFGVYLKAYAYILAMGPDGLRQASQDAVLNANYLLHQLKECYEVPYPDRCMHEFVISATTQKEYGASALDLAKRLLDFGFHPPTIYFPLIVKEALMIEPTETESKETLDAFVAVMAAIAKEAEETPQALQNAPHHATVSRLDETTAARHPVLKWTGED
ncbi:MAG: aminomethyl-transferring glycine dehydrogenase subunit GcvPB [Limnochordia bacterium]|jgi:glycine dehydrogenase subunit 2|nr:aminomethyl-transferring glycine dehydrogenase subunit GcvPB [Limnochordia bacterium]MDD2628601.1 aminomethyl-transferring glycine dehydrogenase subunit GcvPB [Limnochordia bacterium]MDD4517961.1 aminomethyl-transferring glycine dehydrogenase subunit GcvPB [Limnochordia bacterium]